MRGAIRLPPSGRVSQPDRDSRKMGRLGLVRDSDILAYYQLDGGITDSATAGLYDLSVQTGVERYSYYDNFRMLSLDGSSIMRHNASPAALELTAAMSLHALVVPAAQATAFFVTHDGTSDAAADNILYSLLMQTGGGKSQLEYFIEYSGGTNEFADVDCWPAIGVPLFLTLTRPTAATSVGFYVNGILFGTVVSLNAPTSGTAGQFRIGGSASGTNMYTGLIGEVQLLDTELTAAQVLEDARRVMPWL